jgi:hypothetical protein
MRSNVHGLHLNFTDLLDHESLHILSYDEKLLLNNMNWNSSAHELGLLHNEAREGAMAGEIVNSVEVIKVVQVLETTPTIQGGNLEGLCGGAVEGDVGRECTSKGHGTMGVDADLSLEVIGGG